ncbi:MAG: hypothetical protein VW338_09800 [Rhodospirillaceae bacterium]
MIASLKEVHACVRLFPDYDIIDPWFAVRGFPPFRRVDGNFGRALALAQILTQPPCITGKPVIEI